MTDLENWFSTFWQLFPADLCHKKKGSQKKAWLIIEKMNPDEELRSKIMGNLRELIRFYRQERKSVGKTDRWPMVTTWLNGECWNNLEDIGSYSELKEATRECACGKPVAVVNKCDSCFYKESDKAHDERLYAHAKASGLGKRAGQSQKSYIEDTCKSYLRSSGYMGLNGR